MKDFVLLTVVCVAVVVGIGYFLIPGSPRNLFRPQVTIEPVTFSPPSPAKAAGTLVPQQRKPVRAQPTGEQPLTFKVLPTPPDSKPIAPPPPVSFRLPSPWEVLPGAERSDLVDTYGAPALEASTQDSGHMFETLVYRNDRYQSIIHLEDGKVLGVSLKDSPQYSRR